MSDTLESLEDSLNYIWNSIWEKTNERQEYLNKADEIQTVYNRMYEDKQILQGYRQLVNDYYNTTFVEFAGNNYKYIYKQSVNDLVGAYDIVVQNIDTNLDNLNYEILRYQNLASECYGVLGWLEESYNSICTQIENWTN